MHTKTLSTIIDAHFITHHSFADDLQSQLTVLPDKISKLLNSMQSRISDNRAWLTAKTHMRNDNKTALMHSPR